MARKKADLSKMHTHMLLWNLQALENSAVGAPEEIRDNHVARRDELAPQYRAELERRGVEYPKTLDDADWEIAMAKAMGLSEPRPRKVGRFDAKSGKHIQIVQVWDAEQRCYVVQQ